MICYCYTHTISIESTDIPDELISRFNTNTISYVKYEPPQNFTLHNYEEHCELDSPYYCKDNVIISKYEYYNNETHISVACKNNIQCFSNKCVNNTCISNIEANIERCDTLYTEKTIEKYLHCGRMLNEYCTENVECSFNNCSNNRCSDIHYIPSESDTVVIYFQDICKYFELNNVPKEAYLFSLDDCSKTYIYTKRDEGWFSDDIYGCYYRSQSVNSKFGPSKRVDPNQCQFKGRVTIKGPCYYTDDGKEQTIDDKALINPITVRYYDIVFNNNYKRALTEYSWCDFTYVIESELHWMLNLSDTIRINQINIPGTHDSGTYAIQYNSLTGQYEYIRLETDENRELFVTHNGFTSTEFLYKNPCETVIIHLKNEAVSAYDDNEAYHNKDDNINIIISVDDNKTHFGENDYYQTIANLSINNNNSEKYNQLYSSFYYIGDDTFPTLSDARGKIVILTCSEFKYYNRKIDDYIYIGKTVGVTDIAAYEKEIWLGDTGITVNEMDEKNTLTHIGKNLDIPGIGDCYENHWHGETLINVPDNDVGIARALYHETCYPERTIQNGKNILVQDNYELPKKKNGMLLNLY
ncbi:hypothetical protein PIROE2DRAFT_17711 [Piromyces sp. E2]|nr:hypothetical protein PIROE2DRAFT_17711 [Piromyces sp. E2]|eukprot:OUM57343.1 hypothetical protein PIROE2DRAFT_17711 [Piromyces sp. E2]